MDASQVERGGTAALLAAGNATALQGVIVEICPDVARILRQKFRPSLKEEDIEDALAIALSRLWDSRSSYDPGRGKLRDFFYVIARNAALDILRAKARQNTVLFEMAQRAMARRRHTCSRQEEGKKEFSSVRTQALVAALAVLPAMDRHILLEYALSEGEGPWTARIANEFGLPASTIRVRCSRLMEKLRQRITVEAVSEFGDDAMVLDRTRSAGGTVRPQRSLDELSHDLAGREADLSQVLETIRAAMEAELEAGDHGVESDRTPFGFFKEMWNRSVDEGSIEDSTRFSTLKTLGAWLQDVEQSGAELREGSEELVNRSKMKVGRLSLRVEQVERSLIGLSQAFQREMPAEVAREGSGRLTVLWNQGRGWAHWGNTTSSPSTIDVEQAMLNSVEYHGKVTNRKVREALVAEMQNDLQHGNLPIPSFALNRSESKSGATVLNWRLATAELRPVVLPERGSKFSTSEWSPGKLELDLWSKHPELAELMDEAICVVAQSQQEDLRHNVMQELIELIEETTKNSYPRSAIAAMMLPIIDHRWSNADPKDECLPVYERAFRFLASEVEGKANEPDSLRTMEC